MKKLIEMLYYCYIESTGVSPCKDSWLKRLLNCQPKDDPEVPLTNLTIWDHAKMVEPMSRAYCAGFSITPGKNQLNLVNLKLARLTV